MPLCAVELVNDDAGRNILNLTRLLYSVVIVEHRHHNTELPQCTNCQNYGHTKNYCHLGSRCVRCTGDHHFSKCTKPSTTPAQCVNCHGDHPANFRGCTHYVQLKERQSRRSQQQAAPTRRSTQQPLSPPLQPQQQQSSQPPQQQTPQQQQQRQSPSSPTVPSMSSRTYSHVLHGRSPASQGRSSDALPEDSASAAPSWSFLKDLIAQLGTFLCTLVSPVLPQLMQLLRSLLSPLFSDGNP